MIFDDILQELAELIDACERGIEIPGKTALCFGCHQVKIIDAVDFRGIVCRHCVVSGRAGEAGVNHQSLNLSITNSSDAH